MSRSLITLVALVVGTFAGRAATAQLAPPSDVGDAYRSDERGRRFRVVFPLHDRVHVEGGYAFGDEPSPAAGLGLSLTLDADFPDEEIWWQMRHDFALVDFRPLASPSLRIRAVEADYLRHDEASWILVPRPKRDLRLPAPFDITVPWSLLDMEIDGSSGVEVPRLGVVDLAILADFVRDPHYRHRLAVGFASRYDALQSASGWVHEVVPFWALAALWGWEHRSGRFAVLLRSRFERAASIEVGATPAWSWRTRSRAELEWTVLAINDAPLSLYTDGELVHELGGATHGQVAVGARFALSLGL